MVGRSAFCRGVDDLPVVGDLQRIDAELLVRVRPTHVFTQRSVDGVDPVLTDLASRHGWTIVAQPLVDLDDVADLLDRIPQQFPQRSMASRCSELQVALRAARTPRSTTHRPRLLIVGAGPIPLAWGSETYLGQLVAAAGGENLISGRVWRSCSLEDIARMNPDIVLIPSETEAIDFDGLAAAVGRERLRPLVFKNIEIPGPHLALLSEPLHRLIFASPTYTETP
jgi:ABC-type hemin transport system substrate-binding protein